MPSTRRHSYDLNFKLKIVAEAEAVNNNREIARDDAVWEDEGEDAEDAEELVDNEFETDSEAEDDE